ncbi:MAG TPA: sialidase family protein, partial [Pyrinomonadaceae bacterium]|nr:sialidase family protein [Pyrinomonadaceae bacterium]
MKRTLLNASLLFTATFALVYTHASGQTATHHDHTAQARRAATVKAATTPSQGAGATTQPAVVRVSAVGKDAAEPSIAAAKDGSVFVVWVGHGADGAADVWLTHFAADGRRLGATPTRVNPKAGQATAWRGDAPSIALAPDGRTIYVGWMAVAKSAASSSSGDSAALHLSASRDGGRSFAPPVKVRDDPKPAAHGMHSLTVAEDGRVHLAWLDERGLVPPHAHAGAKGKTTGHHMEANRQVYTAYSADGGRTFSPNHLVARDACPCCKTSLAAGAGGRIYVSWRQVLAGDFRHIAVAASEDGGQKFSAPVIVSDDRWVLKGCP